MMRPILLLAFALAAAPATAGVPRLDYRATCRATPALGMDKKATVAACIKDEQQARTELPDVWRKARVGWRRDCVAETTHGGLPSYVELLTCLQGDRTTKAR